jgi:hypothetical protein
MTQKTKPEVWPVDRPFVVFMVPAERAIDYAEAMNQLTVNLLSDLNWAPDEIEIVGLISASPDHGAEGLFFLEEMGVDTRKITLLMLWGAAADCVNFDGYVVEECGIGTVILPETGVILPTVRMPSLDGDWWTDPLHHAYAATIFESLVQDGRARLDGTEPFVFVTLPNTWN